MRTLNRRLHKCSGMYKTITNEELANRLSKTNTVVKTKTTPVDAFDKEYNEFIADLKAKNAFIETNESESVKNEETANANESAPVEVETVDAANVSETSMKDSDAEQTTEVKKTRKKKNNDVE